MRFRHHVFVCENRRADGDPRGCCAAKGSLAIRAAFKDELRKRGLKGQVRANAAGCLDACADGPSVVVYPEGVWYGHVAPEDVPEIVERHLLNGEPVERLRIHRLERFSAPREPGDDGK
ncbi:MAG TPA: (2Fe-2S) ferredoxin domain-containing protein [Anaeromyxobacteraceae bacterium]|nr:(2Fe-2S) ferredoxin domain-containing protein [Anaeromyxobacteraceae bacterium]